MRGEIGDVRERVLKDNKLGDGETCHLGLRLPLKVTS